MKKIQVLVVVALWAAAGTVFAQGPATPRVDQRQALQQHRIDRGVASGALTRHEAHRLRREQNRIARHEAVVKADGVVTPRERRALLREQNQASRHIAQKTHNRRHAS